METNEFRQAVNEMGISLSDAQMNQFADYYKLLVQANEQINLTAITKQSEVYLKHFYDSLTLSQLLTDQLNRELTLMDVGSGAGFPSLPLKIAFPQLQISIVDSLQKRTIFLQNLVTSLGLNDVKIYHERAENLGNTRSKQRESFDVVTARAVAALPTLSEWCLPFVKPGGVFLAMKGNQGIAEGQQAKAAIKLLGGSVTRTASFELPDDGGHREIIEISKVAKTPAKYPRTSAAIKRKPL